jgi:putative transposase
LQLATQHQTVIEQYLIKFKQHIMGKLMQLGQVYHLTDHAVNKNNVFVVSDNYRFFMTRYKDLLLPVVDTYAYCLMPNHFHIAIKVKTKAALLALPPELLENWQLTKDAPEVDFQRRVSKQFSNLFSSYTQALNKQQDRRGTLFEGNFNRSKVEDRAYFRHLILYVHGNPVRHGFCDHYLDWHYSSIHQLLFDEEPTFLKRDLLFDFFGGKDAFIKAHNDWRPADWTGDD